MSAGNQNSILYAIGTDACLTTEALANETKLTKKAVSQACGKLVTRGFVDRVEAGCFQLTPEGKMVVESGATLNSAPVGPRIKPRTQAKTMRVRVWRAIRMRSKFTISDIVTLASNGEKDPRGGVQRYLRVLSQAGYLRNLKNKGKERRYSLIRDTGPKAPIVRKQRTEVYDPNTEETHSCLQR